MINKKWILSVGAVTASIMAAGYLQAMAAQDETVTVEDNSTISNTIQQEPEVNVTTQAETIPVQTLPQPTELLLSEIKVYPVF